MKIQVTSKRLVIGGSALLLALLLILIYAGFLPAGGGKTVVNIPDGSSAGSIGCILAEKGIVRSPFAFKLLVRLSGKSGRLQPGAYELSGSMTPSAVLKKIVSGEVCARWVTVPEGFTVRQVAERLAAKGLADKSRFESFATQRGQSFKAGFPSPGPSLEGYLFPDTYLVPEGVSEEKIIDNMLQAFCDKVAEPLRGDIAASGMSMHQVITLASLIEREAKVPGDRALVSAVLHNRLKKNMRLQVDATVLYSLGAHKSRVLYRDLTVDSPYNTYRNAGLPPGPIANPGLASIKAALHPANADYLYYVARPDGSHIFSRTIEEHADAIKLARRKDSH
jgi:UPF0755 protein